jgi:hypothetical protein
MTPEKVDQLRAIECLRGGVPSRSIATYMPPKQVDIRERFESIITNISLGMNLAGERSALIEGNFGTGKSHWLDYFKSEALANGFICSSIALNKETPLHDIAKIFRECVDVSSVGGVVGSAIRQIASSYDTNKAPGFREMCRWAKQACAEDILDRRLAESLLLFDRTNEEEVRALLLREWMGFPMKVADFRNLLRQFGESDLSGITRPSNSNYLQRFDFVSRLLVSAGYKGWIILIDEIEVVAKYSLLQRAKSYSNIAQLFGTAENAPRFVGVVGTITTDYVSEVLRGVSKNDMRQIPQKYGQGKNQKYLSNAVIGMNHIDSKRILMQTPKLQEVAEAYHSVAELYSQAYNDWETPDVFGQHEYSSTGRMRQYIRSWINAWDLRRIYSHETKSTDIIIEDVLTTYEEDLDIQSDIPEDTDWQRSY